MKKIVILCLIFLSFIGCEDDENPIDSITLHPVGETLEPRNTGLLQGCLITETAEALPNTIIVPAGFPATYDLSHLMPPILNQGSQGSCVAFATAYYLKSFQEKIQHNYPYLSNNEVMSPAFVYNQSKISANCTEGSCIENALFVLKDKGVNVWSEFPYTEDNCANLPTVEQLNVAAINKIASYHNVQNNTLGVSLIDVLKTLILAETPIVIGMQVDNDFKDAIPLNNQDIYVCAKINQNHNDNHAMLIVGYDNVLNAFKVVNSWGENWANDGFAYVHYDFFINQSDANYKEGLLDLFVAYDLP